MFKSVRPLSRFANYEKSSTDQNDSQWSAMLMNSGSGRLSVQLTPYVPSDSLAERFICEKELILRILSSDMRAAYWFARQFEQLAAMIFLDHTDLLDRRAKFTTDLSSVRKIE